MEPSPDPLAGLIDDRLPALTMRAVAADWTAGIALGLIAALILGWLITLIWRPRPTAAALAVRAFEDSAKLPAGERLLIQTKALQSLATALKITGPDWLARLGRKLGTKTFAEGPASDLSTALYQPAPAVDPDVLQAELTPLIRKVRL